MNPKKSCFNFLNIFFILISIPLGLISGQSNIVPDWKIDPDKELNPDTKWLNFLGTWWSTGEPRFSDELFIGWTKHIIKNSGAVTWDLPLSDEGIIYPDYYNQLNALSKSINNE